MQNFKHKSRAKFKLIFLNVTINDTKFSFLLLFMPKKRRNLLLWLTSGWGAATRKREVTLWIGKPPPSG